MPADPLPGTDVRTWTGSYGTDRQGCMSLRTAPPAGWRRLAELRQLSGANLAPHSLSLGTGIVALARLLATTYVPVGVASYVVRV